MEPFYVERMLNEILTSTGNILIAFRTELAVSPKSQGFEFIYHYSGLQVQLEASKILQDLLQKVNLPVKVIEDWEKREDTRGLPSRWSLKDEDRYGEMPKNLTTKCKIKLRKLRIQHKQFDLGDTGTASVIFSFALSNFLDMMTNMDIVHYSALSLVHRILRSIHQQHFQHRGCLLLLRAHHFVHPTPSPELQLTR